MADGDPQLSEPSALVAEAERLRAGGSLGRSERLIALFDYLLSRSTAGRAPKEVEIAMDVFGRPADFDAMQDAVVRVYVHKLRQRLVDAYAADHAGPRLSIPRGDYRLILTAEAPPEPVADELVIPRDRLRLWIAGALAVLIVAVVATWALSRAQPTAVERELASVRKTAAWSPIFTDHKITLIVLGDYYLFGESDNGMDVARLVREYMINSRQDLDEYLMNHPDKMAKYMDLDLRYLPIGSGLALRDVSPILAPVKSAQDVRVVLASDLTPTNIKAANIVYVGYFSGLGILKDVAFSASRFQIGESFDDVIDRKTRHRYASNGGQPMDDGALYKDYGYFASFRGPEGNRIVIIAGARDAALMQTAETVSRAGLLDQAWKAAEKADSFEALYEVDGMNRMNVSGRLVTASPLDPSKMWRLLPQ